MINRRDLILATASAAALAPMSATAQASEDATLTALFDAFFKEDLQRNPESATQLGLDVGANAALRGKLSDNSAAGIAAAKAAERRPAAPAGRHRPERPIGRPARSTTTPCSTPGARPRRCSAFDFGGSGFGPSPYVVSQLTGAYQSTPEFLDTKHPIETSADADAYLARLEAFAGQLDHDTERMAHDAGLGVVPPDFLLDTTLIQMTASRTPAEDNTMVASLARRAADKGLAPRYAEQAAKIYDEKRRRRRWIARSPRRGACARARATTPASASSRRARPSTPWRSRPRRPPRSARTRSTGSAWTRPRRSRPGWTAC